MKWLTIAGILLYLTRHSDAGVTAQRIEREEETASDDTECLAGSEWESNCHKCRCSDSGVAECLKQDSCDDQVFGGEPIKCKPYTSFKRGCNTCTCVENGLGLCTVKDCAPVERKKRQIECKPGSTWQSTCNSCHCLANGLSSCTKRGCLSDSSAQKLCAPDTEWKNDCNACHCTSEGQPECTNLKCSSEKNLHLEKMDVLKTNSTVTRQTRAVQEPPKTCQPGQEFRMDCNKCLCNDEGQDFSCTRIDCAAANNNGAVAGTRRKRDVSKQVTTECVPSSVFDRDCNVCRCTEDGMHATCTIKRCKQETAEADTEPTPSFRCTPGDQFKRDCNDCTCSADGKNVFCTLRLCDQELADI